MILSWMAFDQVFGNLHASSSLSRFFILFHIFNFVNVLKLFDYFLEKYKYGLHCLHYVLRFLIVAMFHFVHPNVFFPYLCVMV